MVSVAVQLGRSAARGSATTAVPAPPQARLAALAGSTRPCPGDEAGPLLTQPPPRCSSQPPPKSPIATGYGPGPPGGAGARAAPIPNPALTTILSLNLILIQPGGARGRAAGATRRERYAAE